MRVFPKRRLLPGGLSVIDQGQGATVVLLHGVGLCADVWRSQQEALATQHRVISVDLPGHGGSALVSQTPNNNALSSFAVAIEEGLRSLTSEPVAVVGHSLGALLAAELSARGRLPVSRMALVSPVYRRDDKAQAAVMARATQLTGKVDHSATLTRWFGERPHGSDAGNAELCRKWLRHATARGGYAPAYAAFAGVAGLSDSWLSSCAIPLLFLTGSADPNSTARMSQALADEARLGQLAVIDRAAHMLTLTHAGPVNGRLGEFLRQ
ncbi:MAG: alpha/beta hydrolase [Pseudomonadota bacterium]